MKKGGKYASKEEERKENAGSTLSHKGKED